MGRSGYPGGWPAGLAEGPAAWVTKMEKKWSIANRKNELNFNGRVKDSFSLKQTANAPENGWLGWNRISFPFGIHGLFSGAIC